MVAYVNDNPELVIESEDKLCKLVREFGRVCMPKKNVASEC